MHSGMHLCTCSWLFIAHQVSSKVIYFAQRRRCHHRMGQFTTDRFRLSDYHCRLQRVSSLRQLAVNVNDHVYNLSMFTESTRVMRNLTRCQFSCRISWSHLMIVTLPSAVKSVTLTHLHCLLELTGLSRRDTPSLVPGVPLLQWEGRCCRWMKSCLSMASVDRLKVPHWTVLSSGSHQLSSNQPLPSFLTFLMRWLF